MQRIAILLVILAVLGGAYYLISSDDAPGGGSDLTDDGGSTPPPKKGSDEGLKSRDPNRVPDDATAELLKLSTPANVLLIGQSRQRWPALVEQVFGHVRELGYRTWYMHALAGDGGAVAGPGRGMAELKVQPTAEYLKDHDVRALFLDQVDPNAFPLPFWNVVGERVRSGAMGLWFRPGMPLGADGKALTMHAALSHPVLKELLPVARAALIQGEPTPGVLPEEQKLLVTDDGVAHPASRFVANEAASRRTWGLAASGAGTFVTKFCYPVIDLKPGAQSLVEVAAATPLPALIAGGEGKARVLWMGNPDFGHKTNYDRAANLLQGTLVNHWVIWLVGQAR